MLKSAQPLIDFVNDFNVPRQANVVPIRIATALEQQHEGDLLKGQQRHEILPLSIYFRNSRMSLHAGLV